MVFDTELGWSRDVRSRSGRDVAGIDDLAGTDVNWSYWTLCSLMSEHILLVVVKSCTSKAKYCGTRVEWISHPSPESAHGGDLADDLRPRRSRASISINGSDRIGCCLTSRALMLGESNMQLCSLAGIVLIERRGRGSCRSTEALTGLTTRSSQPGGVVGLAAATVHRNITSTTRTLLKHLHETLRTIPWAKTSTSFPRHEYRLAIMVQTTGMLGEGMYSMSTR